MVSIDDSALAATTPNGSGVLCVVGECQSGQPQTPLGFVGSSAARATLGSGPLVDAVTRAFAVGPNVPGAPTVYAIRVNPGTQSLLGLPAGTISDLATPSAPTLTESSLGGSMVSGTYQYRVTATNSLGETLPSPEAGSAAVIPSDVTTGSVLVVWPPVAGASGYNVYGRTASGELFLAHVPTATYTDTGTVTPDGALPGANTTGGAATAVELTSIDYGSQTRQISINVQTALSGPGQQISTSYGGVTNTAPNVYRTAITAKLLDPTWATTATDTAATLDISGNELTIVITPVSGPTLTFIFDLTVYATMSSLVNAMNNVGHGLQVAISGVNATDPSLYLDEVTATSIYSIVPSAAPVTFYANHQAVLDYFNNTSGFVTAAVGNVRKPPANTTGAVYMGSDSTADQGTDYGLDSFSVPKQASTNTDWANALTAALTVDVSVICVATSDSTIQGMLLTHVDYASSPLIQRERIMVAGGAAGESVATAVSRANGLRDPRCMYVYPGILDTNPLTPYTAQLVTWAPWVVAAQLAGMLCGGSIADPLTHRYISAQGVEKVLTQADITTLLQAGVVPIESVANRGYRVVHSITTWTATTNYRLNEVSIMRVVDQLIKDLRSAADDQIIGRVIGQNLLAAAVSLANSILLIEQQNGLILSYGNISASNVTTADTVQIEFTAEIAIPANYVSITAHLTPFTGSV